MAKTAKTKSVAKNATKTRVTGSGRVAVVADKSVRSLVKNYVVSTPNGQQVILENKGLTTNQAKQMALPILRRNEDNTSLSRNDLSAKQVPVFNL